MFHPSTRPQQELMESTYKSVGIDPLKLTYIEGHMTGTKVSQINLVLKSVIITLYCYGNY